MSARIRMGRSGRPADDERRRDMAQLPRRPAQYAPELPACDRIVAHEETLGKHLGLPLHVGRIARLHRLFRPPKSDRDIDEGPAGIPLERYKSSYNNVVAAVNFTAESKGANFSAASIFRFRLFRIRPDRPLALPSEQRQRPYTHGSRRGRLRYGSAAGPL